MSTVLLSAFQALLHRYSGQDDLLIGSPMAGRTDSRFRRTVGYCVSPVALRASLAGDPMFRSLLGQAHRTVRGALRHQDYPLGLLVEELQPWRDPARSPLFDVMFNYIRAPQLNPTGEADRAAALLPATAYPVPQQEGQFDLVLELTEHEEALDAELRYSLDLFEPATAEGMAALYRALLEAIVANPDAAISELPLLDEAERRRLTAWDHGRSWSRADPAHGDTLLAEPATPVEEVLAAIYAEVLGVEHVGAHDDFFAFGGHSLRATQVVARIRTAFGVDLPVRTLFEAPTVSGLAAVLERQLGAATGWRLPKVVERVPRDEPLPLSFSQERMWLAQAMRPNSSAYNVVCGMRLHGRLDVEVLGRAVDVLVQRHEGLRTSIVVTPTGPAQVITPQLSVDLPLIDLSHLSGEHAEAELRERASVLAATPFDLSRAPLVRLALFRLPHQQHVLVVTLHHVVSDSWSLGVLVRELAEVYQALLEDRVPRLPDLPFQYADFARWQRAWFQGDVLEEQLAYWREHLAGLGPLQLPTDRPRLAGQADRGAHRVFEFPGHLFEAMRAWSRRENATPFMACLAAFATVLHRYTAQADIAIGVPIANRRWLHTESLIGTLVNTLVVRTDFSTDPSARELLQQVRARALDAYAHQDIPFELLVAELQPERAANRSPLFQVMFDYVNTPIDELRFPGSSWTAEHVDRRGAQFDLALIIVDMPQVQRVSIEYNTDLFDTSTIERLVDHLRTVLEAMLSAPDQAVSTLPLLPDHERQRILVEWNATAQEYPRDACVHELVRAQAQRTPDATAVIAGDAELTYRELERRSNKLARHLRDLGIGRGRVVAVDLERTALMPVALLGILKAGAAYLPIDPAYPAERRRFVLDDSGAVALPDLAAIDACEGADGPAIANADDAAYVIYTSGSTGRPKGVQVGHRGVVNFLHAMRQQPGLGSDDTLVAVTTLAFDIAVLELFLPLITGARLVIASRDVALDGGRLAELLASSGATCMQATPVTWRLLVDAGWRPSRRFTAICGGEPLPPELAADLLARGVTLWNAYGPTETTVWSTLQPVTDLTDRIPIGRPIANTRVYVLDRRQQLAPIGVWGELYIGGDGVAHGYLGRPELTAERFVPDPFDPGRGARLYRTGDVARFKADGTLDVLGRVDHQVKIRGHRVELGEIEVLLRQHPSVRDACVSLRQTGVGEPQLVAYLTPATGSSSSELRGFLRQRVPEAMVPAAFVWLEALPRTPNGKLDRAALPAPGVAGEAEAGRGEGYTGPRDETERILIGEWEELLGCSPIGVHDDFFDLGGHSLLAIRLVYRLRAKFGWHVPLASLLRATTVAGLAELLRAPAEQHGWRSLVEIQTGDGSAPVFFVHGLFGDLLGFAEIIRALGPEHTIFGLRAHGLDGMGDPLEAVEEMASAYIDEMRSVQPHGPYRLVGWSSGGSIAYEIACQLDAASESVAMLAILDHPPAGGALVSSAPLPVKLGRVAAHAWRNLPYWLGVLRAAEGHEKRRLLADRLRAGARLFARLSGRPATAQAIVREIEATHGLEYVHEWPEFRRRLLQTQLQAMAAYRPRPYPGRLVLFRCRRQPLLSSHDPLLGWGPYARGGVEVVHVPGTHRGLLHGMSARFLGTTLSFKLAASCSRTPDLNVAGGRAF
jgi:amino acid adenylation domain-containing protein